MSDRDTRPWRLVGYGPNEDGKETVRHHPMHRTPHGDLAEGFGPDAVCAHDTLTWPCATAVVVRLPEA